jgi:hypothetical protein
MTTILITSADFLNTRLNSELYYRFGQLEYDFSDRCIAETFRNEQGSWTTTVFFTKFGRDKKVGFLKTKKQVVDFINKYSRNSI